MNETKKWYTSVTLWGTLISVGGKVAALYFGAEITPEQLKETTDQVVLLANTVDIAISLSGSFIGDALAFYGRLRAKKAIG